MHVCVHREFVARVENEGCKPVFFTLMQTNVRSECVCVINWSEII